MSWVPGPPPERAARRAAAPPLAPRPRRPPDASCSTAALSLMIVLPITWPELAGAAHRRRFLPDRSHAPYWKRPASANACRKIDKKSANFSVAFLLREVANQLWLACPRGLGIGALIFRLPQWIRAARSPRICPTTRSSFPSFPTTNSCSRCMTTSMTV
ncbi:hypothetical protein MPL3365_30449 [Mesorhizobium plurifarium]|uniref:Uncharacterized protein n=1 Tax=Mesorhizobium plurifarium TaxID=69974 RepID=A0A090G804_MESPL|nr:hypothetical protein MPL3365_30449 [Mesorhizobium plurifarium]